MLLLSSLYKDHTIRGLSHVWKIAFHGYSSYSDHMSEIHFTWSAFSDQPDDIRTESKWLKSCFSFRDNERVCVLLIRLVTMKETCTIFFCLLFSGFWSGAGKRVRGLGNQWGVRHASNKDGFYIVHFNQAEQCRSLKAWSGGRSGRQSLSLW